MLGIKQIQDFPYVEVDSSQKIGDVFFFGNPCEVPQLVYADPFTETGIHPSCKAANQYNKDKIIELTDLKSLLIKNVKLRDNLSLDLNDDHPLQLKIGFIKELIEETALNYLKYINRLMWVDMKNGEIMTGTELTKFEKAVKDANKNYRWKETGISFDTAVEFCRAMTKELTAFFSLMIDLRYDAGLLHDKLESDFSELVNKYRLKSGMESKKHHHKK